MDERQSGIYPNDKSPCLFLRIVETKLKMWFFQSKQSPTIPNFSLTNWPKVRSLTVDKSYLFNKTLLLFYTTWTKKKNCLLQMDFVRHQHHSTFSHLQRKAPTAIWNNKKTKIKTQFRRHSNEKEKMYGNFISNGVTGYCWETRAMSCLCSSCKPVKIDSNMLSITSNTCGTVSTSSNNERRQRLPRDSVRWTPFQDPCQWIQSCGAVCCCPRHETPVRSTRG